MDPVTISAITSAAKAATETTITTSAVESNATVKVLSEGVIGVEAGEAFLGEKGLLEQWDIIKHSSRESLILRNEAALKTINEHLIDLEHPLTKVPFIEKEVKDSGGTKKIGVFPDFTEHKASEVNLPETLLKATDKEQFDYCNEQLKKSYDKGEVDTNKFTDRQLEQINNGDKPEGYTWHHNEDIGKMELVKKDIHELTRHTGGKSIWGGGKENR